MKSLAIRTREEITNLINERITANDDSTLELIGDLTDTINDLSTRATAAEQKAADTETSWRKRYRDRFFGTGSNDPEPPPTSPSDEQTNGCNTTFNDIFKEMN